MHRVFRVSPLVVFALFGQGMLASAFAEEPKTPAAFKGASHPTLLFVVAPESFANVLNPLITHKNSSRMPSMLVTMEALRRDFPGRDDAESLKRGVHYAHAKLGAKYVMLAGDASLLPVRYRQVQQVPADANLDGTYNPSELYYSNLYRDHAPGKAGDDPRQITHSGKFDSWDQSGNGVYNEQHWNDDAVRYNPDHVDGCPDVALGRVPAHTPAEMQSYVGKLIRYESGDMAKPRHKRFTFVADRGYGGSRELCGDIIDNAVKPTFPSQCEVERLYLNYPRNARVSPPWTVGGFDSIDAEAGKSWWLTYLGHAAPTFWAINEGGRYYDGARVRALTNNDALPVVFTIGCESGRFMSYAPSEKYRDQKGTAHWFEWNAGTREWLDKVSGKKTPSRLNVPQPHVYDLPENRNRTFACDWLLHTQGGAIAFFGETLVCENDKGRDVLKAILQHYKATGCTLGDMWLDGQRKYWLENCKTDNVFRNPRIYLGIMTLFGDPSLRLAPAGG